jgi:nickel-dependent lactate racemase
MIKIEIPYGNSQMKASIPNDIKIQLIDPPLTKIKREAKDLLKKSMDNPIGTKKIEELVSVEDKVAIVVNDHTRPGPYSLMLQEILNRFKKIGISENNLTILFATGSHRSPTKEEIIDLIGEEISNNIKHFSHNFLDERNMKYFGKTSTGMPVYLNRLVVEADFVITLGLIAPHQTAGFSGGRKSIVPGVASFKTLKIHHSFPYRPYDPTIGVIRDNLFHDSALEVAKKLPVNYILNVVFDSHKKIVGFVAGDVEKAFNEGIKIAKKYCTVEIEEKADIVIASPGGYPRDLNLYQSQKALGATEILSKKNGIIILVAECIDGLGEGAFYEWMAKANSPEEVVERFKKEGYTTGSNKAFLFSRALIKNKVIVVSTKLSTKKLEKMGIIHYKNLQKALDYSIKVKNNNPNRIIIVPRAVSFIPKFL